MNSKRILLISAYDAKSHQYWHQQLINGLPQYQWQLLTLKDRFFAWRMGGNAMSFKHYYQQYLAENYDFLVATSMTDLSTLIGLYPHLSQIPKYLYFHENQFAYPKNKHQQGLIEMQLRTIYSAIVADKLIFNSHYNKDTFLTGVTSFVKQMPDGASHTLTDSFSDKSSVLPVPIKTDCTVNVNSTPNKQIEVLWNHRWEHDKGPETLLALIRLCADRPHIKFHVLGQQFKNKPTALQQIIDNHSQQCLNLGYVESRADYIKILQQADVALSTAMHDFQGIAMLEAVACGCQPIVPNRLVYPELYPQENRYDSTPDDALNEAQSILKMLENSTLLSHKSPDLSWHQLQSSYAQLFD